MKARFFFMSIAAVLLLFTHCVKEDRIGNPPSGDGTVRFIAGLASTRVTSLGDDQSEWEDGDTIGVYMVDGTKAFTDASILAANKAYVASNSTGKVADFAWVDSANIIMFPQQTDSIVHFYAYYPYASLINALSYEIRVPQNQDDKTPKTMDILYSGEKAQFKKGSGKVALKFSHKMVKLVFHITDKSSVAGDFSSGLKLEISNMYENGALSLTNGTVRTTSTQRIIVDTYVTVNGATLGMAEAFVLPMTNIVADKVKLTFTKGSGAQAAVFEAELPPAQNSNSLESGSRYIYQVELKDRSVSIVGTIEDWIEHEGPVIEPS
ncbi:MAG: fimbrillin family protein [Tannerellaceae bacterium]|jgi:hypothetical protein|nr:fimbrillin family protein [Tannerellaceae bacterium]